MITLVLFFYFLFILGTIAWATDVDTHHKPATRIERPTAVVYERSRARVILRYYNIDILYYGYLLIIRMFSFSDTRSWSEKVSYVYVSINILYGYAHGAKTFRIMRANGLYDIILYTCVTTVVESTKYALTHIYYHRVRDVYDIIRHPPFRFPWERLVCKIMFVRYRSEIYRHRFRRSRPIRIILWVKALMI